MKESTRLEKLLAEPPESEGRFVSLKQSEKTIFALCDGFVKATANFVFRIGKELTLIKENLEHGKFTTWLETKFPFSVRTARNYMMFFERFKTANFAVLENLTMTEALRRAGFIEPKKEKQTAEGGEEEGRYKTPWEQYFELPPLDAEVDLKNHRFEMPNPHEIYLIRRGFDYPVKIAEVVAPGADFSYLKTAHKGMMEGIQKNIERYFQEVERVEKIKEPGKKRNA